MRLILSESGVRSPPLVPWTDGRWIYDSVFRWFDGLDGFVESSMDRWFDGSLVRWFTGSMVCSFVRWSVGSMARCFNGSLDLWNIGLMDCCRQKLKIPSLHRFCFVSSPGLDNYSINKYGIHCTFLLLSSAFCCFPLV